jgi:hypothetical protein
MLKTVKISWLLAAPHIDEIIISILRYLIQPVFLIGPTDETTEPICTYIGSNDAD